MRKQLLTLVLTCCALAMTAQDAIRVQYQGARPTISDFARAFFASFLDEDDEGCGGEAINAFSSAFTRHSQGLPLDEGETIVVDEKNGYIAYESNYDSFENKMEMCYWNEADGRHKLFVFCNMATFDSGKPIFTESSDLMFYRYDSATKKMTYCPAPGFEVDYGATYTLPCTGKDITVTTWRSDGTKTVKTLKWNGRKFTR